MKKIDFYIIRKFLGTFFFILMLLVVIAVVIDLSEKIDNFIKSEATPGMIIRMYYANFIPHIAALLAPFFVLVAVVFFTSTLASRSEIIAMTSGGVSFYRLILPYFISASVIGGILLYANHYYVPNANKTRNYFEWEYLTQWKNMWLMDIHRKINTDTYVYLSNFSLETKSGSKFSMEKIGSDNTLSYKLNSEKANWDDSTQTWTIYNYQIRTFENGIEKLKKGDKMDTVINFNPEKLGMRSSSKDEMTTPELVAYIEELKNSGLNETSYYELEKERRTGSIYALFILTLIGYSLASRKVRGGLGLHIVTAIILAGTFEIISKFSTTYTTNAGLSAFWGIWIPNIVFTFIALFFVRFAQK